MNFTRKHFLLIIVLCAAYMQQVYATHYRAGEILYKQIGNFQYEATVITYTKISGVSGQADRDTVEIFWGDGTSNLIPRVNGPDNNGNGVPDGEPVGNDIQKNIYIGTHTYPGAPPPPNRFYIISFYDENRIGGILNIDGGNSVNIPFYVEDTLFYPSDINNIGFNSSPILINPPIDYANLNDTFYHNPNAYDPDGDSLDFQLINPRQDQTHSVPVYSTPGAYCVGQGFATNTITIDRYNGQITWAVPCRVGYYNIAILVTEFRNGVKIGTLVRDMQIFVDNRPNNPPQISGVRDTCIRAGDRLTLNVTARDPDAGQTVTLTAAGGAFEVSNPATFTTAPGNPTSGTFNWNTNCENIRKQFYLVVFKAEDNYMGIDPLTGQPAPQPLADLQPWQIIVIPPPVQGLTATPTYNSVTLNWQNPYPCASFSDFRGFSVWRKVGCDSFVPNYCETDLASHGYVKITGANIFTYTYTDFTSITGQQYSYRILAHFDRTSPNGIFHYDAVNSTPSDEVCVFMPISVPVILNVDVEQTDVTNGQVFVRWAKPIAGGTNLDTLQSPPPYKFDLYRGEGFNLTNASIIHTTTATSYSAIVDTTFTDTGLNTQDGPYSYRVMFYANTNDSVGYSTIASSIYLNVGTSDQSLPLTWSENVPWTNDSFSVFRLNKVTSLFDSIGIAYNHNYTDTGLTNDSTYCYYVKGYGHYTVDMFPKPLINKSQQDCGVPIDTVSPCPPTLTVTNDCGTYNNQPWTADQFINYLSWVNQNDPCADDINRYYIYFGDDSTGMRLIDSITSKDITTYNHVLDLSLAGCYAVTAVDRVGNESAYSNIVCIDNCPYYVLPNTFTPNGDGQNDLFHPYKPYRFIAKIEMRIFNRWGEEVFRTEDPEINWDGKDQKTGKPLSEGVYLYAGFYYEQRLGGLVKRPLSGDKKGGGFIHLMLGKQ